MKCYRCHAEEFDYLVGIRVFDDYDILVHDMICKACLMKDLLTTLVIDLETGEII